MDGRRLFGLQWMGVRIDSSGRGRAVAWMGALGVELGFFLGVFSAVAKLLLSVCFFFPFLSVLVLPCRILRISMFHYFHYGRDH